MLMEVGADAHQTFFVVSVFADYLHQQVVFPLSFLQLTDKRQFCSPVHDMLKVLRRHTSQRWGCKELNCHLQINLVVSHK